ncbi:hypothetical protein ZWY2020_013375 [Hordeum vulgare]|nr:hypothetical protein ZWY2020_013375 [Hordeum vulgare]
MEGSSPPALPCHRPCSHHIIAIDGSLPVRMASTRKIWAGSSNLRLGCRQPTTHRRSRQPPAAEHGHRRLDQHPSHRHHHKGRVGEPIPGPLPRPPRVRAALAPARCSPAMYAWHSSFALFRAAASPSTSRNRRTKPHMARFVAIGPSNVPTTPDVARALPGDAPR